MSEMNPIHFTIHVSIENQSLFCEDAYARRRINQEKENIDNMIRGEREREGERATAVIVR